MTPVVVLKLFAAWIAASFPFAFMLGRAFKLNADEYLDRPDSDITGQ